MKEFRNVPSKLYTHEQWVSNEKQVTQAQMKARTESGFKRPQSAKRPNMNYHEDKTANLGMFEKYYYEKLKEKNLIHDEDETEEAKERIQYEKEIDKERQVENVQNIEDQLNEQYESIKKAKLKEPTPSSNDKGLLLPKTPKNYLKGVDFDDDDPREIEKRLLVDTYHIFGCDSGTYCYLSFELFHSYQIDSL